MEIIQKIWHRNSLLLLVAAAVGVVAATFVFSIREDEAWIGEQAYRYFQEGRVFSVLWQGYHDHEKEIVVHHYLFVRITAWLLYLLPWDVLSLRLIPLLCGGLLAGALMLFASRELSWTRLQVYGLGALFILIPINFEYLTYYRPEFVVALFGFGSFWALFRSSGRVWLSLLAGALAGLAMLTHLNGLVFVLSGGVMLLLRRDPRGLLVFGLAAALAFLPFLLEIVEKYEIFRLQLSASANTGSGNKMLWYSPLINLLNEQKRLFRGPVTIFTSALLVVSALVMYKAPKDAAARFIFTYLLLIILFLGLFAVSKTSQYSILFYPQTALIIAFSLQQYRTLGKALSKWMRWLYVLCWYAFTLFALGSVLIPFITSQPDLKKIHSELAEGIPEGRRFLAPMAFTFNQIDRHEILALTTLFELDLYDLSVDDFIGYTQKNGIEYMVLNDMWKGRIKDLDENREAFNLHFAELKTVEGLTIYKVK